MTRQTQPDVRCACGHDAVDHDPIDVLGCDECECRGGRSFVYRAALAASKAALAEAQNTVTFLRGEVADARADYDDMLRERNAVNAEVERLRADLRVTTELFEGASEDYTEANAEVERLKLTMDLDCKGHAAHAAELEAEVERARAVIAEAREELSDSREWAERDIAAERQQIADALDVACEVDGDDDAFQCERLMERIAVVRRRIASGGFAPERQEGEGAR